MAELRVRVAHRGNAAAIAVSPDARTVAIGERHGAARLWSLPDFRLLRTVEPSSVPLLPISVALAKTGVMAIGRIPGGPLAGGTARVRLYEAKTGRFLRALEDARGKDWVFARTLRFSPDGSRLIVLGGGVFVHSTRTGRPAQAIAFKWLLREGDVDPTAASVAALWQEPIRHTSEKNGRRAYLPSRGGLRLIDLSTGRSRALGPRMVNAAVFVSPNRVLAASTHPLALRLLGLSGETIASRKLSRAAERLYAIADRRAIVDLGSSRAPVLYGLPSLKPLRSLSRLKGARVIRALADNHVLVFIYPDRVQLWRL